MLDFRGTLFCWSLCLAAGLVSSGCVEPEVPANLRVRVEAGPPKVRDVDVTLRYPVDLEADESVAIAPVAISGFLRKVLVDVGDKVKSGQLIAVVDCREYVAQRTQAKTAIAKREAEVDESRTRFDRLMKMGEKLVAPAEIDNALKEARVAEAELADAQAKLSEAGQRQGYCSLTAPFSGYVTERFLDPGAMVGPGGPPVVNIVKTFDVRVVASLTEQDAPKVKHGAEVDLVLHAFPDTSFRAEVTRIGRALDPATRTLRIEMSIPNKSDLLLPGMTGRAAIVIDRRENALIIPMTALLKLEDATYTYVVRDDAGEQQARRVEVKTGVDFGDWIEILEGITETDQIITLGRELVDDGTPVEPVEPVERPRATPSSETSTPEPRRVSIESDTTPEAANGTTGDPESDTDTDGDTPTAVSSEQQPVATKAQPKPAADATAADKPTQPKPAAAKPAAEKPAADKPTKPAADKPATDKPTKPATDKPTKPAADKPAADKPASGSTGADKPDPSPDSVPREDPK